MKTRALRELLERFFDRTATGEERKLVTALQAAGEIEQMMADVLDEDFREFEDRASLETLLEEERMITAVAGQIRMEGTIDPGQDEETVRKALDGNDNPDLLTQSEEALLRAKERCFRHVMGNRLPVQEYYQQPPWRWLAAAAVLLMVLASGVYYGWQRRSAWFPREHMVSSAETRRVQLSDGTTVVLNHDSRLVYDDNFGKNGKREVSLVGEAFFDVHHDPVNPFIIHSLGTVTQVLGTAFSINAYPQNRNVLVTVTRGLVQVGDEQGKIYGCIYPDQQIVVARPLVHYDIRATDADMAMLWKEEQFEFNDVSLEDAVARISARFDVTIEIDRPELRQCRVQAAFLNDGLTWQHVLDQLGKSLDPSGGVYYKVQPDGRVLVKGTACR
ncbi:FecR family protein [Dawidia soli]|uniref:FecR domain-containing protein n=1 Tax=Dawidia soli TaxID=2782352 RepID=A0AAP2DE21_9BACT|nr:FecR domain-containing protein [Dawidia soli]MBT1690318.1 FecR domain-containing protein [Dawidia soli]